LIIGLGLTVSSPDALLVQPVEVCVNKKFVIPGINPVTIPFEVTEATKGLALVHVPDVEDVKFNVPPTHICVIPPIPSIGKGKTVIVPLEGEEQLVEEDVNIKLAIP
jgi:hypothetical protein